MGPRALHASCTQWLPNLARPQIAGVLLLATVLSAVSSQTARDIMASTRSCLVRLRKALFPPWIYDDPVQNLTIRWDPRDDARYALRWSDPSGDPTRKDSGSVLGANVLAILGLPLIPSVPMDSGLETVGFPATAGRDTIWIWPLWSSPIDVDTCRSLLARAEPAALLSSPHSIQGKLRAQLKALGVVQCFRTRRITVGKFRSFTSAESF